MRTARALPVPEFEARVSIAQWIMRDAKIDALVLMTKCEFAHFALSQDEFCKILVRPWFCIEFAAHWSAMMIPCIGKNALKIKWAGYARIWAFANPGDGRLSLLAETHLRMLRKHPCIGVPIGAEMHQRMPANDVAMLRDKGHVVNLHNTQWPPHMATDQSVLKESMFR